MDRSITMKENSWPISLIMLKDKKDDFSNCKGKMKF